MVFIKFWNIVCIIEICFYDVKQILEIVSPFPLPDK